MFKNIFKIKKYSDISDIIKNDAKIKIKSYEDVLVDKIVEKLNTTNIYSVNSFDGLNFLIEDGKETFSYWITLKGNKLKFNLGSVGEVEYELKDSSVYDKRIAELNIVNNNEVVKSLEKINNWLTYVNRA